MKVHFIGIGGIGVSALARYYLAKGNIISGSDLISSEITRALEKLGAKIFIGPHKATSLTPNVKKVIYSVAVKPTNPELKKAQKLGIQIQSYPQALGELTKQYFTIAVCGAHGKGTTTAMISLILIKAGLDPTVIIGTKLKEFGDSNCRVGKSKYLVIEADEYAGAFLNYWPKMIVLTNIDKEHLDYYKDLNHVIKTFGEFVSHLPKKGILVTNKDNKSVKKLINTIFSTAVKNVVWYSLKQKEADKIGKILKIPGKHNVSNALAALAVARALKIPDKISFDALSEYKGAWRRFEIKRMKLPTSYTLISDYAHHPTEIKATIAGAKEKFKKKKIWVVFQPHQYQRTYYLFDEFKKAFDLADEIILTKIYSVVGREKKEITKKVSSEKLAKAIQERGKKVHFVKDFEKIPQFLKRRINPGDIVLIMGAGSIYKIVEKFS